MAAASSGDPRPSVLAEARRWIGTPYHHQASTLGAGCDCVGLIRGVWRAIYGAEPEALPPYTADWGDTTSRETVLEVARRHLHPLPVRLAGPGDVVVFRIRDGRIAKHAGILSDNDMFIHSWDGAKVVCEVSLSDWWRERIVAAFAYPLLPA